MTHKSISIMIGALLLLTAVSGCLDATGHDAARLRWERTMDQARLQAAREQLDKGQLHLAERLLEECDQDSRMPSKLAEEADQLRERIQTERQRFAKIDTPEAEQAVY